MMISKPLQKFLSAAAQRQDIVIVAFILAVIAVMIVPLPTWLMDLMIALNIAIAMLFLLLAVYLRSPLEFSTLPSAILIATLVRIAVTIATSRLILMQGDAGEIVSGFGNFVIAGNVVVGLVIFAIIAIAQFIVVTKGAERVAEVAARFALDALPGKQMSIDSDLRAGDIDRNDAKRRRLTLERESQYYGAMDGAMKFVKGDAIVSMIVIFVNLIGGLLVGMVKGMDASTAFQTYALLTVGDGLASQIPALLVAVAGGIVVTRVTTENSSNLGSDLARELVSSAQSLAIVAVALWGLALVPGFPTMTFLGLGSVAGAGALSIYLMNRRRARDEEEQAVSQAETVTRVDQTAGPLQSKPGEPLSLRAAPDITAQIDGPRYRRLLDTGLAAQGKLIGIKLLTPGLSTDAALAPDGAAFDVDGAPAWRGRFPADAVFVPQTAADSHLPGIGSGSWSAAQNAPPEALDLTAALAGVAVALTAKWAARSFGMQEADTWLTAQSQQGAAALSQQVRQTVPMTRLAETLRHLLAENVPLTNSRLLLEALLDLAPKVEDKALLADQLRLSLSRPLSAQYADSSQRIPAIVIEPDLEDALRQSLRETPNGIRVSLDPASGRNMVEALRRVADTTGTRCVVLTSFDVRRALRLFIAGRGLDMPVLASEEIAADYEITAVDSLNYESLSNLPAGILEKA